MSNFKTKRNMMHPQSPAHFPPASLGLRSALRQAVFAIGNRVGEHRRVGVVGHPVDLVQQDRTYDVAGLSRGINA